MRKPKQKDWINRANGNARQRTFDYSDWNQFERAWSKCLYYARLGRPFYWSIDAGGVANKYGYTTTTAVSGCWVSPDTKEPVWVVYRANISSQHVGEPYHGGKRQYDSDWLFYQKLEDWPLFRQYCVEKKIPIDRQIAIVKSVKFENSALAKARQVYA